MERGRTSDRSVVVGNDRQDCFDWGYCGTVLDMPIGRDHGFKLLAIVMQATQRRHGHANSQTNYWGSLIW